MRTATNTDDQDRRRLATRSGDRMLGPTEWQRCEEHGRKWVGYRWTWPVGETPESGDAECIKGCSHPDHDDD